MSFLRYIIYRRPNSRPSCPNTVYLRAVHKFQVIYGEIFKPAPLWNLQWPAILGAMGLGFCLSLLFFMDQNIAGAMVNSPDNRYGVDLSTVAYSSLVYKILIATGFA